MLSFQKFLSMLLFFTESFQQQILLRLQLYLAIKVMFQNQILQIMREKEIYWYLNYQ